MWAKTLALRLAPEGIAVFEVRPGHHPHRHDGGVAAATTSASPTAWCRRGAGARRRTSAARSRALASGAFGFATGSVIACDGGLSIARL